MTATVEREMGYSVGAVARLVGRSPSAIRRMELAGLIPAPPRIAGRDCRVYSERHLQLIRTIVAERDAARQARGAA